MRSITILALTFILLSSFPQTTSGQHRAKMYLDGYWNTFCVPFNIDNIKSTSLATTTIMELDTEGDYDGHKTGFDKEEGILYLFFKTVYDPIEAPDGSIVANMPYIMKGDPQQPDNDQTQTGAKLRVNAGSTVTSQDGYVSFIAVIDPVTLEANDKSVLYLGDENTLYYPGDEDVTINALHAYFQLNGIGESDAGETKIRSIALHFGNEDSAGITSPHSSVTPTDAAWYTLSGSRLSSKPTLRGLYIHLGQKVMIR